MRRWLIMFIIFWSAIGGHAQEPLGIALELPQATPLQTGQPYQTAIRLDNAQAVWVINFEVLYDPTKLYIVGSKSGQPITPTSLFNPNDSIVIRNEVQRDHLNYTVSMLSPAEPVSGSDILGNFTLYPLSAGTTTLTFLVMEAVKIEVSGEADSRQVTNQVLLPVSPINLTLDIIGDTVAPPEEATATPAPSPTAPSSVNLPAENNQPTAVPTFVSAIGVTATPLVPLEAPTESATTATPFIIGALVIIIGAVMGLGALVWVSRRQKKRL